MMGVGLLDRYLWRHLRDLFVFGVAVFTLLFMVNHLFLLARIVLQQGAPLIVALELLAYKLPYFVAFTLPMGMLLSALMAIGRLSDGQEITAMRTSGISLSRIAASVVAAGMLVSLVTLILNEEVVPRAEDRYRRAFAAALSGPSPSVQHRVLFRDIQDGIESVYFIRQYRRDQELMEGVVVNQFERGQLRRVIEASRGTYVRDGWEFHDGRLYVFGGPTTIITEFERLRVALRRTPEEIALPQKDPSEMTIRELRTYITVLQRSGEGVARYLVEVHSKMAIPAASALFALLAVPVGLRPHRSGTSIGLGLAILVLILYYIMTAVTRTLGDNGRLHPIPAAWLPNVILAGAGFVLLRRAERR